MRIALLSDDYLPDSTRSHAKMMHELAVEFVILGHQAVVITPGNCQQPAPLMIDHIDGVEVWRFRSPPTRGVGKIKRAINETLLSCRAYCAIRSQVQAQPFDLCVNYSPTIFFGPLAFFLKRRGAYIFLVLRDFFPQWIIDEGMISEKSLVARYFRFFEHINYQVSDCVALQSPANLDAFQRMYSGAVNTSVLMNWTATNTQQRSSEAESLINQLGLNDKVIFFYGGNIGHAQDMANIMRLAKAVKDRRKIHFLLVGQGDEFNLVGKLKKDWQLGNVTLMPPVPQNKYQELLSVVDAGLFSLSNKHFAHNFPGKLLGYMSHSLPILGSVNVGNDVIDVVNSFEAGFVTVNGDDENFIKNALLIAFDPDIRERTGKKSHQLLKSTFSVASAADNILNQVSKDRVTDENFIDR